MGFLTEKQNGEESRFVDFQALIKCLHYNISQ